MANYEFSQISGDRPCCRLSRHVQICLGVGLLVLIALVVILVIVLWPRSLLVWNGSPTTKHFPEIFLGRCLVYTQILRPEMSLLQQVLTKNVTSATEMYYLTDCLEFWK
ncbi:ADP-ribosyl cyclase/cyclic ADP-ribose hydrolase 1 [Psammomys obesus]|uniref:ADP-ribosyl cyclase/cyclic ADP-ribose hydrolase 1 n=1 Tax=Psammomys obesus TaxID=48139 RepID=UPI002452C375|nr:ADP-ribosyl cyclase/cyclic ADP-ribose hydrolase 1 [Psammomys obesus]